MTWREDDVRARDPDVVEIAHVRAARALGDERDLIDVFGGVRVDEEPSARARSPTSRMRRSVQETANRGQYATRSRPSFAPCHAFASLSVSARAARVSR